MTKLITIPKFAATTGLPYRLCLQLVGSGQLPSIRVGRRRRIDVRWLEQWLAGGGYRPSKQDSPSQHLPFNTMELPPIVVRAVALRETITGSGLQFVGSNQEQFAFTAFERLFKERGLPQAIRSDNGVPFASPNGLFNLSRLSVWWLRLGISIERIKPGNPQQNGRHERMHLTLKKEATRPAGVNLLQQQAKFDTFLEEFNHERPHEALDMKTPS